MLQCGWICDVECFPIGGFDKLIYQRLLQIKQCEAYFSIDEETRLNRFRNAHFSLTLTLRARVIPVLKIDLVVGKIVKQTDASDGSPELKSFQSLGSE